MQLYTSFMRNFKQCVLKVSTLFAFFIHSGIVSQSFASVNAQETLKMGESMFLDFRSSLPGGFHAPLKRKVKTMEYIKCQVAIGDMTLCDIASPFCVFITVEQHRQAELFDYELCAVPASIIDECGCLRTETKSILFSKLKVDEGRRSC